MKGFVRLLILTALFLGAPFVRTTTATNLPATASAPPAFDPFASGRATAVASPASLEALPEVNFDELRAKAEKGDAASQCSLGLAYYQGVGVPKDRSEAVKWFRKAADQGIAVAQHNLGVMYGNGDGVPKDSAEGVRWYRKAADQGDAEAEAILGQMYADGDAVPKDSAEAAKWTGENARRKFESTKAMAEKGLADYQWSLGEAYAKGEGVAQNLAEAAKWYRKAAEQGDVLGQVALGNAYRTGLGVAKDSSEAIKWYRKAAERNSSGYEDPDAQYEIGNAYASGSGVPQDIVEAVKWWKLAGENESAGENSPDAEYMLGRAYARGEGVMKNDAEAVKWLRKSAYSGNEDAQKMLRDSYKNDTDFPDEAAELTAFLLKRAEAGDAKAAYQLAGDYFSGDGVMVDKGKGEEWIRKAAEGGYAKAQSSLGYHFANGDGESKDQAQAIKWYRRAADQGDADAQESLARMYDEGNGVPQDHAEAMNWYLKAAAQRNVAAEVFLGLEYEDKDDKSAVMWLRRAARQNEAMSEIAQDALRDRYNNGKGFADEDADNVKLLQRLANKGNADADFKLFEAFSDGEGVMRDREQAQTWLKKAAEDGYAKAQLYIAMDCTDKAEAIGWLLKAAFQGYTDAQIQAGMAYEDGTGVPQNYIEAFAWFNIATASGQQGATAARDRVAQELGPNGTLIAQQRCEEILTEIADTKSKNAPANSLGNMGSRPEGTPKSSGSGAIVSTQGHVLTAAHVVVGANSIEVVTAHGIVSATILSVDEANDIAILKIEGGPYVPLTVAPSRGVRLGQGVATIGFPNVEIQGFSPKVTRGEISSLSGAADDPRSWQISVPVQPGNSGGPLLDENGNLIGVVESKLGLKAAQATRDIPQSVSYAVKSAYALALLEPYLEGNAPAANPAGQNQNFEDMVAKAQQSVVLILVY